MLPFQIDSPLRSDCACMTLFVRRFGDEQRQLRQKCQFVCSTHFLTPINLLSRAFMARRRTAVGESLLALQIGLMACPWLKNRKWTGDAADSAVELPQRDRNGGSLTFGEFGPQEHSDRR